MSSEILVTPTLPATGSPVLQALVCDGLASDDALDELGRRLVAVRLVFPAGEGTRCCAGHQPALIAMDLEDPTLPDHQRSELEALRPGHAIPGRGLQALTDGLVALPGGSLAIGAARDLGEDLAGAVIVTLADAARGLVRAGADDAFTPRTVVVVRGREAAPPPWRVASETATRIPLSAGLPTAASHGCHA